MIVNPQFFNYKIIIGSLIVTIASFGVFGFTTYESYKAEQHFLKQEKKLVENELSQMILRYDELSQNGELISDQLDSAKKTTHTAVENLRLLTGDLSVLTRFKSELSVIKSRNNALFNTADSTNKLNERLEADKLFADKALNEQKQVNHSLLKLNETLRSTIKKGSLLTANSFSAIAYKSGEAAIKTSKASQVNSIDVCFTLAENALTEKGTKEIYIQILNPLNNVIGSKGSVEFGEALLIYSDKQLINYNNQVIDICTTILAQKNDLPFTKGKYYVSVFLKDRKLGDTQIVLN